MINKERLKQMKRKAAKKTIASRYKTFNDKITEFDNLINRAEQGTTKVQKERREKLLKEAKELIELMGYKGKVYYYTYNANSTVHIERNNRCDSSTIDSKFFYDAMKIIENIPFYEMSDLRAKAKDLRKRIEKEKEKIKKEKTDDKKDKESRANDIANLLSSDENIRKQVFRILAK